MNEQGKNFGKNRDIFRWYRWIRLTGITLAVYVAMEYILPVVFPFCVGFIVAGMLYPLRRKIERRMHAAGGSELSGIVYGDADSVISRLRHLLWDRGRQQLLYEPEYMGRSVHLAGTYLMEWVL